MLPKSKPADAGFTQGPHGQFVSKQHPNAVPIEIFINKELFPEKACLERLAVISRVATAAGPIVALPDVYLKEKNFIPTGISMVMQGYVSPTLLSPPNDAFCLASTSLQASDLNAAQLDAIFAQAMNRIGVFRRSSPIIDEDLVWSILTNGLDEVGKIWGFQQRDRDAFSQGGNAFGKTEPPSPQQILKAFPKPNQKPVSLPDYVPWRDLVHTARHGLGVLDGGSHFVDLVSVAEIYNPQAAACLNLVQGQVLVAIHNGAADVGIVAHHQYLPKDKDHIALLDMDQPEGKAYWTAYRAAVNFGNANRLFMLKQIFNALEVHVHKPFTGSVLSDVPHDLLETINWQGQKLFLHRKGASRALPAKSYPPSSPFSKTGLPFYFPTALGRDAYIMANFNGNPDTYYTCSHGTGRRMRIDQAALQFDKNQVIQDVQQRDVRLYRFGKTNFATQSPDAYKSIDQVFQVLGQMNLANPIARLRPLATLKS